MSAPAGASRLGARIYSLQDHVAWLPSLAHSHPVALPARPLRAGVTGWPGRNGEVYRARDTRLTRTVAIRFCPPPSVTVSRRGRASSARRVRLPRSAIPTSARSMTSAPKAACTSSSWGASTVKRLRRDLREVPFPSRRAPRPRHRNRQRPRACPCRRHRAPGREARQHRADQGGRELLDFGLAGLRPTLFERDTVTDRAVTHVGQMMGTLQYMARNRSRERRVMPGPICSRAGGTV